MKRMVTYSLLAHINDGSDSIKDLNDIFIPLTKRILFLLKKQGVKNGLLIDIKELFDKEYGLKIPITLLKRLLHKISDELINSKRFIVHYTDGSFMMEKCTFDDYGELLESQEYAVQKLIQEYEYFLAKYGLEYSSQPSLFEFIDNNRIELVSFFEPYGDKSLKSLHNYEHQIRFIQSIVFDHDLYSTLKKIYLGSIISCYLECDNFGHKTKLQLLFDSTVLIGLLDLTKPEDCDTCKQIVEICGKMGHEILIMDFTIEETENWLLTKAEGFTSSNFFEVGMEDIYRACLRRNISKTDLQILSGHLIEQLEKILKGYNCIYRFVKVSTQERERVKKGEIYRSIKDRPNNKDGALHDALAYNYILNNRKSRGVLHKKNFFDSIFWFVSHDKKTPHLIDAAISGEKKYITPNHLVNILWLSNPCINSSFLNEVGLTNLISSIINDAFPKAKIFSDLKENFRRYSDDKITGDDMVKLAYGVATNTITLLDIDELNSQAENGNFIAAVQDTIIKINAKDEHEKLERINLENELNEKLKQTQALYEGLLSTKQAKYIREKICISLKFLLETTNSQIEFASAKNIDGNKKIVKLETRAKRDFTIVFSIIYLLLALGIYFGYKPFLDNWNEAKFTYLTAFAIPFFMLGALFVLNDKIDLFELKKAFIKRRKLALFRDYDIDIQELEMNYKKLELLLKNKNDFLDLKKSIEDNEISNEELIEKLKKDTQYDTIIELVISDSIQIETYNNFDFVQQDLE